MTFYFHPDNFFLRNNEHGGRVRFSAVVAHESHHVMRWRGPGYGSTLGEMMVSEGLALKFERETQHPNFQDDSYLRGIDLQSMSQDAQAELDNIPCQDGGFLDRQGKPIDHYVLGLALVEGWSKYAGLTAASAYNVPADEVLGPWRSGKFDIILPVSRSPQ